MLYLHCGWPKTGTTSLQSCLFEQQDRLAAVGLVYPRKWKSALGPTHHGIRDMLEESLANEHAFDDFIVFLEAEDDRDVLISAEVLTTWLALDERRKAFVGFLNAVQQVTPVRCIWTLRRHDDQMKSSYLLWLKNTGGVHSVPRDRAGGAGLDERFAGMKHVEEAVAGEVVYLKYDPEGGHNQEILRAFGLDQQAAAAIGQELVRAPRLNTGVTYKQGVALLNAEALSARAGAELDRVALRDAFAHNGFEFEGDRPCDLVDLAAQRKMHEKALAAARRQGFAAYLEFFGEDEINGPSLKSGDTEAIGDADLKRLVAFLGAPVRPCR